FATKLDWAIMFIGLVFSAAAGITMAGRAVLTGIMTDYFTLTWLFTGERIARQIREQYFRAVLRQNIAYFDKYGSGEVTTRITSDIHLVQDGISEKVPLAFLV
ncbi:7617_t:CDS:2, partial [Gigaspora rosea]